MAKLPKFTVSFNDPKSRWELKNDSTNKVVKTFQSKIEIRKGGVLEKAVGNSGGSVKIQLINGKFEEERTYPENKDPKGSVG